MLRKRNKDWKLREERNNRIRFIDDLDDDINRWGIKNVYDLYK